MRLPNQLANTTSAYLLQHAYNPIQWYTWDEQSLNKAQQEDKPILLSIGYAACHWCHVMAKESFEDKEVAVIMNENFINIKVDREENPDIDQIAIEAVQAMGLQVGWPLHVFLMPNQQPFYGGTYFNKEDWKKLLTAIIFAFKNHRQELAHSSFYFTKSLQENSILDSNYLRKGLTFEYSVLQQIFQNIYHRLDHKYGGIQGSPKFFMPSISHFLLDYYHLTHDQSALDQLHLTLINMACGGIYDHLGGGFYRYATDEGWLVPHFEKMLYDNAQLLSLYAHAYMATKNEFYNQPIRQTVAFVERELLNQAGGFYSSIDADSQGIEGAFYTWTYEELSSLLEDDLEAFAVHYNISVRGNWQEGRNILYKNADLVLQGSFTHQKVIDKHLARAKEILYAVKYTTRPKPTLNEQVIASWNGMMLQALVDVYYALGESHFLQLAIKNAEYIENFLIQDDKICHTYSHDKQGRSGYLEDYVWVAKAFVSLYEATLQAKWLYTADRLIQYAINYFKDTNSPFFYFTNVNETVWIKRTQEIFDQVIPSSNAIMAHTLLLLGRLLNRNSYIALAHAMIQQVGELLQQEPLYMSYWANLYLLQSRSLLVVTIVGANKSHWGQVIKQYYPSVLLTANGQTASLLSLEQTDFPNDKTAVYICSESACYVTLYSLDDVLLWLKDWVANQKGYKK